MELKNLQKHIRYLATMEETEAPVISCYLNLELGLPWYRNALDERVALLRKTLTGATRRLFEEALDHIEAFIATELLLDAKGAVIFSRAGEKPLFLPLQFRMPLPNWFAVYPVPNIYHRVELKDTYHHFVVMISTEQSARVLEINLGAVTEEIWKERPELRDRISTGWTKEHYQHHRKAQTEQFIAEKIKILDRLMSAGGYTHLILAGDTRITALVKQALPKHLSAKLVDIVAASPRDKISDVVAATVSSFVMREEMESLVMVDRLQREINTNGLAVAGTEAALTALMWGQADVLVIAKAYESEPGWLCASCSMKGDKSQRPKACPQCGGKDLNDLNLKEEMVRLAEKHGCKVEIVSHSDVLMMLGGVGCLLRYRMKS